MRRLRRANLSSVIMSIKIAPMRGALFFLAGFLFYQGRHFDVLSHLPDAGRLP